MKTGRKGWKLGLPDLVLFHPINTEAERVNGRYAQYLNAGRRRTGHLWQNRYFSCPVAAEKEEIVLRYTEWNPVRAAMVDRPEEYKWSSAAAHLIGPGAERIPLLDWTYWSSLGGGEEWKRRLEMTEDVRDVQRLRRATYAGSPLGSEGFVAEIEERFGRQWRKPGRPKKDVGKAEKGQSGLLQYRQDEKV